jgi:hypothetical protein
MAKILLFALALPTLVSSQLAETDSFFVIKDPSDWDSRAGVITSRLFQDDHCQCNQVDNPLPVLQPVTVAFMPSQEPYQLGNVKLGYYTLLVGLGETPDDVIIQGDFDTITNINSQDNVFFKSLQNLQVKGDLKWYVSQGCPLRSVHVTGTLDVGSGVGGYMGDGSVDGQVITSQVGQYGSGAQEYLFRNVKIAGLMHPRFNEGQMNFVFVDSEVPQAHLNDLCSGETTCGKFNDDKNSFSAPSFSVNSSELPRPVKDQGLHPKIAGLLQNQFCKCVKTQEELDYMLGHLDQPNMCVLIYPGTYMVLQPILLNATGIQLVGLGFPVLRSALSQATIAIDARASNCTISSLIVDAPLLQPYDQEVLIDINGADAQIFDVFTRTNLMWESPPQAVKTGIMLRIARPRAFLENIWLWRGDHWAGPDLGGDTSKSFGNPKWDPYNVNPYGLVVEKEAAQVTCLGCFVEHHLWNDIYWNGDDGLIIMTQGECPYTNNGVIDSSVAGNPAKIPELTAGIYYTVGASVTAHNLIGGGIYNIFGTKYSQQIYPAVNVLANITEKIQITKTFIGGWVQAGHFTSVLLYKGVQYGPKMDTQQQPAMYLCDLLQLTGSAPTPAPPPSCTGFQCTVAHSDYADSIWPVGTQNQFWQPVMTGEVCCNKCASTPGCAYWKVGWGTCFYYTNTAVSMRQWTSFVNRKEPGQLDVVGIAVSGSDGCCTCSGAGGGGKICGPTQNKSPEAFMVTV